MDSKLTTMESSNCEKQIRTTRNEYSDGSYEEITVEKVEGGYIKTVCKNWKDGEEWKYDTKKSVSVEDPMKEKTSLIEKLAKIMGE